MGKGDRQEASNKNKRNESADIGRDQITKARVYGEVQALSLIKERCVGTWRA